MLNNYMHFLLFLTCMPEIIGEKFCRPASPPWIYSIISWKTTYSKGSGRGKPLSSKQGMKKKELLSS